MNLGEPEVLLALISSVNPVRIAEFGVNEGLTARFLIDNILSIQHYIGVDITPRSMYKMEHAIQQREVPGRPGYFANSSSKFRLILRENGSIDCNATDFGRVGAVFIDGDHGRKAVEHDTALARLIVKPGGIIVWHDYHEHGTVGVQDVLEEQYAAGAPIQYVEGTWLAFERIPERSESSLADQ